MHHLAAQRNSVILKPRIDIPVAMILGGAFIAFIGFVSAFIIGLFAGLVPGVFGLFGLMWIVVSIASLRHRRHFAVIIDASGITIPTGNVFRPGPSFHIPREVIATIAKDESIHGRFITIALRTGGQVPIQARHYCELKKFLKHCREFDLPVTIAPVQHQFGKTGIVLILIFTILGLAVAALAMNAAWQCNPDGRFHDQAGVHWKPWLRIGYGWFIVVTAIPYAIGVVVFIYRRILRLRSQR